MDDIKLIERTLVIYEKLNVWASIESFLKLSDFEYSRVSYDFLKGSITIFMFTICAILNISKQVPFEQHGIGNK